MCGIAGIINRENRKRVALQTIVNMTNTMEHRGPDECDTYVDSEVALGHRRLRIIDLSPAGKQPMFSGDAGIVFNGEIYNFLELRSDLIRKGYRFRSKTDTEVIICSYLEHGIRCLEDFLGMFAFALYDRKKRKVFLVRDRLGIKPLYYAFFDGKLIFASEIKAILEYPEFERDPDLIGISSYLSFRYPIDDYTLFQKIRCVLPGHYLEIDVDSGEVSSATFWSLPVIGDKQDLGEAFYVNETKRLVEDAVKYRLISDVPLGAYLSGGLDSSVIVANMSALTSSPVKTFTIGFREAGFDEFSFAKLVSDMHKTKHFEIVLSAEDYIDNMVSLIRYKDSPLGVANEPALYAMSKELKHYITVVLSGEGADEIFGGYGRIFRSPYDYERLKELPNDSALNANILGLLRENLSKKYGGSIFRSEIEHFLHLYSYIGWEEKKTFLSPEFLDYLKLDSILTNIIQNHFETADSLNLYDKYMWLFEKIHLVGLLHRVDTTTMAASVEARVPFADHRLVEFAMSVPVGYKLRWKSLLHKIVGSLYNSDQISEDYDIPKYILKKSFEGVLPKEVIVRRKMGFPVPVHLWFGGKFNNYAKEVLLDSRAKSRGIYNSSQMEKMLADSSLFDDRSFGLKVWMLLNLELWFKEYFN